jgi:hypothetical protein
VVVGRGLPVTGVITTEPEILAPLGTAAAKVVEEKIDALLSSINTHELGLASSYARLGALLQEVRTEGYWMAYGFSKFSDYLESIRKKIRRKRSQMYAIIGVAETLLPVMSEEKLEEVGITKAYELRRLVKEGRRPSLQILDPDNDTDDLSKTISIEDFAARRSTTAARLRVVVNEALHIKEEPHGPWMELGGFYAWSDEKEEIDQFWELGKKILGKGADRDSEHEVRKGIFLAAVRECLGTWGSSG